MIVKTCEEGWIVIFQPAHGLLAAKVASESTEERRFSYWFEMIIILISGVLTVVWDRAAQVLLCSRSPTVASSW